MLKLFCDEFPDCCQRLFDLRILRTGFFNVYFNLLGIALQFDFLFNRPEGLLIRVLDLVGLAFDSRCVAFEAFLDLLFEFVLVRLEASSDVPKRLVNFLTSLKCLGLSQTQQTL